MKTLQLLVLLICLPVVFHAQRTLTGLWTGTLSNDSTTVRVNQPFEIALTQYKQKVYGYCRSSFIVNDTLYYIVKRVKGTIEGDVCEVTDDEILTTNFKVKPEKGVHVTYTFRMNPNDSTWKLDGNWKTNRTKKYYAITGKIELKEETNLDNSKLFPHLEELKKADDVEFYAAKKAASNPLVAVKKNEPQKKEEKPKKEKEPVTKEAVVKSETKKDPEGTTAINTKKETVSVVPVEKAPVKNEPPTATAQTAVKPEPVKQSIDSSLIKTSTTAATKPVVKTEPAREIPTKTSNEPVVSTASSTSSTASAVPKTETAKQETPKQEVVKPAVETSITKNETAPPVKKEEAVITKPEPKAPIAAEFVAVRKTVAPQVVTFKSDSLQLALYDNGEVDGDTVSVLMNGEIILAKQGLRTSAIKKTIMIAPGTDEINLILYAENLGKYPPNTGLLVVHDGDDVYQVRFSADLQQNASVIFRRKGK